MPTLNPSTTVEERTARIAELRRDRPRDWFLRASASLVAAMVLWAWLSSGPLLGRLPLERRISNLKNFAAQIVPEPVAESGRWGDVFPWAWGLLNGDGFLALANTLAIATAAIILAAAAVIPFLTLASRRLSRVDPFSIPGGASRPISAWFWKTIGPLVRFAFVISRSLPEYLFAFLLLSLLGPQVWPLVLALAIHNFGILGRLWGEVAENEDSGPAEVGIAAGAPRLTVFGTALFPAVFNRFLVYFFYRWETCIKDATVLGMLGLLTLGKLIALSKGFHWDETFFYVLAGASLIVTGDLFSTWIRARLR